MQINEGYMKTFEEALELVESGEATIEEKSGHHEAEHRPPTSFGSTNYCTCTTVMSGDKYSYRDIKIRVDDKILHYYHQYQLYTLYDNGDIIITQPPHHNKKKVVERVNKHLEGYEIIRILPTKGQGKWALKPVKTDYYHKDSRVAKFNKLGTNKAKLTKKQMVAVML